jgi:hypothetical protein
VHTSESAEGVNRWNGEFVEHADVMSGPRWAVSGDMGVFVSRAGSKCRVRSNALKAGPASRTTKSSVNFWPGDTETVSVAPATENHAARAGLQASRSRPSAHTHAPALPGRAGMGDGIRAGRELGGGVLRIIEDLGRWR